MRIKTFTLMTLALLVSVMSFAQKSKVAQLNETTFKKAVPVQSGLKQTVMAQEGSAAFAQKNASSKPSKTAIQALRRAEVVTPPADADIEYYQLNGNYYKWTNGKWSDTIKIERTVKVVWDGDNDVYISGLCYYADDAFVKGTFVEGTNELVFAKGQYLGDIGVDAYINGYDPESKEFTDVKADYDPTANTFTFKTQVRTVDESLEGTYAYGEDIVIAVPEGGVDLPVEAPSDLVTDDWSYSGLDYWKDSEVSKVVKVGFYGEDVYIQGLCQYLPEAWVKGTLDGNTITFPGYQLYGTYSGYSLYMRGLTGESFGDGDVIFTYDAEAGKMTTEQAIFLTGIAADGDGGNFAAEKNVVITKIVERPGVPANPSFGNLQFNPSGDMIEVNIAVVDTDGNGLIGDKLYFKLYGKDELGSDIPLTFSKDLYTTLEEDMTEIPYTLANAEFGPDSQGQHVVALKMEHADWETIGLQSIYKGAGETHESEIVWYKIIRPYTTKLPEGLKVTVHDFSGTEGSDDEEFASTLNIAVDGNDLYIQGLAADAGIEDTWVKGTKGDDGVYTFALGQDLGATSRYRLFLVGYNDSEDKVEEPKLEVDEKAGVYRFVNCFLANANYTDRSYYYSHFHANSTIAIKGESDDPVVAPDGLVVEDYTYQGTDYFAKEDEDPNVRKTVKIGFAGNDVYLQGIASPYMPQAWIKGKKAGNKITFRTGQQLGAYNATTTFWFRSFAADMSDFADAVFTYDEESGVLTTDNYLSVATTKAAAGNYIIDYDVVISKIEDKATTPSAPTFGNLAYTPKGNYIEFTIPTIDINGEGMLSDKLFYKFYSKDASGNVSPVIFTKDIYSKLEADMEEIPYGFTDEYDLYDDVVYLNMDFSKWSQLGLQTIYKGGNETNTSEEIVWYNIVYPYSTGTLPEGLTAKAAEFKGTKTATSGVSEFTRTVNIAQKDNLLYIQGISDEKEGTNAAESLMIGVKGDNDTYTFPRGALLGVTESYLFFLAGYDDATKKLEDVKMQLDKENKVLKLVNNLIVNARYTDRLFYSSWYNAGSTIDASSIIDETGINVVKNEAADAATSVFNLAGQRVSRDYKGLVIKNGKKTFNK